MATTKKKASGKNVKLENAKKNLDASRAKHYPDPEQVKAALLGWWEGMEREIYRVDRLLAKFCLTGESWEYLPGFEWVKVVRYELDSFEEALREQRPSLMVRTGLELTEEVLNMLPECERD